MQKIFVNTVTREFFDSTGNLFPDGFPKIAFKRSEQFQFQLCSDTPYSGTEGVDPDTDWTKDTQFDLPGVTALLSIDNDFLKRRKGSLSADIEAGSVSQITAAIPNASTSVIRSSGILRVFSSDGAPESFQYTSYSISGTSVTFSLAQGSEASSSYPASSVMDVPDAIYMQASMANSSDPANGLFVFDLVADSPKLRDAMEYSDVRQLESIAGMELLIFTVSNSEITPCDNFICDSVSVTATIAEANPNAQAPDTYVDTLLSLIDAALASGFSVQFSADGSSWHDTQQPSDTYMRFRLTSTEPAGSWVTTELIQGPPGTMPVISGGSATALSPGSDPTVDIISSGSGTYSINFGIPSGADGVPPVLSGGSVTTLPPGTSATAELVSSGGSTYILNLGIPQGQDGVMAFPIQPYSSDSAYSSMTCIAYNGGGYQVISGTTAGENPDNAASKFICFASKGTDGTDGDDGISPTLTVSETASGVQLITSDAQGTSSAFVSNGTDGVSPVVSATQTSSGAVIVTSDALGSSTVEILNGTNGISPTCSVTQVSSGAVIVTSDTSGVSSATILHGRLEGASEVVSSLTSGAIVLESEAVPVYVRTSAGTLYPVEKGTITISSGSWHIDPAAYLAYDGVSSFAGPWTVYYAGGLPDFQYIHGGSSSIVPLEHQVYQISISSGASVTVDSSSLNSSVCMTAELWLDMPSSAVSFTLPAFTWIDGGAPLFSSGSTRYVITIRWNGSKFLANLAYTEALA